MSVHLYLNPNHGDLQTIFVRKATKILCCSSVSMLIFLFFISLARQCAQLWLKTREALGHPLGIASDPVNVVCPKELLDAAVKKVSLHIQLSESLSSCLVYMQLFS